MKFYRIGILSLMLMGMYLQADATKEPACKSIVECDKLSHSIEVQIDELEVKGTLTKDEKRLRYNLRKQLLAAQRAKTARQREIIAEEKAKQVALERIFKKLDAIEGSLK